MTIILLSRRLYGNCAPEISCVSTDVLQEPKTKTKCDK